MPGYVNYKTYVPAAQKRYMELVYGPGGPEGYVSSQVRGAASAFQPYFQQMSKQGAAGIASRGGAGGGASDYALSNLYGQKTGALIQAGSAAEADVASKGLQALGLGLQEGSQLSRDEQARLIYELQKAYYEWQKKYGLIGDVVGAGGMAAGFAL